MNLIKIPNSFIFHIVMEYCSEGELLKRIIKKDHFSE